MQNTVKDWSKHKKHLLNELVLCPSHCHCARFFLRAHSASRMDSRLCLSEGRGKQRGRGNLDSTPQSAFPYRKDSSSTKAPFNTFKFIKSPPPALLMSSLQIKSVQVADSAVYYCPSGVAQWLRKHRQFDSQLRSDPKVVHTSLMFQYQTILPLALLLWDESPHCITSVLKSFFFFNLTISKHIKRQKSSHADLYWLEAELQVCNRLFE